MLPGTLNKVAVSHVPIEQVIDIPVPISSAFLLLPSTFTVTGAVRQHVRLPPAQIGH